MVKRRGVFITVDEKFFQIFEKERQKEQLKLRQRFKGAFINLTQRNFTAILAEKNFNFNFPITSRRLVRKKRMLR